VGIFERLFKKKTTTPLDKKSQTPPPSRRPVRIEEDTRPIKLPLREEQKEVVSAAHISQTFSQRRVLDVGHNQPLTRDVGMHDEEIDDVIDSTFDELFSDESDALHLADNERKYAVSEEEVSRDKEEARDLFGQIAVNYIRPLKQFMFELHRGSASADWIPVCIPAIQAMNNAMSTMKLNEEAEVLDIFKRFLEELQSRDSRIIDGDAKQVALDLYGHLEEILPQTFRLGDEGALREGIIIFSLMKQIPEVGKVTLDKLIAAGLSTLEMLFLATPEDLNKTTGIPLRVSEKMCEKIAEYKHESENRPVDQDLDALILVLQGLFEELKTHHQLYEELISTGWNDPDFNDKKKKYRKIRQESSLKINVLLAELGEVDLVEEIEKLPFDTRIERLELFIADQHKK